MKSSDILQFASAHLLQLSLAILLAAMVVRLAGRRLPQLAFLICMLALAKCIIPPLITSPAGLFTLSSSLSFTPSLDLLDEHSFVDLKHSLTASGRGMSEFATTALRESQTASIILPFWVQITVCAWLFGIITLCVVALRKYATVLQIIRASVPAPRAFRDQTSELSQQLGLRRHVRVLVSKDNYGPACIGVFRPTLILPNTIVSTWSDRLLTPIVAHELVHARRYDAAWGYVQFVAQVLCWFHPLVWWLGGRAQMLCERCCDDEVVSSLKLSRADYAESLVRVLELRMVCKTVPMGSGVTAAQITSQRLECLAQPTRTSRTSRGSWLLACIAAAAILPGMQWAAANKSKFAADSGAFSFRDEINTAIRNRNWVQAIGLLQPLVDKEPENAEASFLLGYALHGNGQLDEAIVFHAQATICEKLRPIATYNMACALALKGENSAALSTLKEAITLGFLPDTDLTNDADLTSLFQDPGFAMLNASVILERSSWSVFEKLANQKTTPVLTKTLTSGATRHGYRQQTNVTENQVSVAHAPNAQVCAAAPAVIAKTAGDHAVVHAGRRQRFDIQKEACLPQNCNATFFFQPQQVAGSIELEGTLQVQGSPTVRTKLVFRSVQDGGIEKTIVCSVDGTNWTIQRTGLLPTNWTPQCVEETM